MAVSGRVCFAILISAALSPALAAALPQADQIAPLAEQDRLLGPLLTETERSAWEALTDDADRAEFVRTFWAERDPTPGTPVNERRDIFEARAHRALDEFSEGPRPGYATDRGRVMLVYGLPDHLELRAVPAGSAPTLTWIYTRHAPAVTVRFAEVGEEFRLEQEPELSNAAFLRSLGDDLRLRLATAVGGRGGALGRPELPPTDTVSPTSDPESDPELIPALGDESATAVAVPDPDEAEAGTPPPAGSALPTPPEVAPEVKIWMAMVFAGVQRQEIELQPRLHFFPAAEGTYTVLTFEVGTAALEFVAPVSDPATTGETPQEPEAAESQSTPPVSAAQAAANHLEELAGQAPQPASADLRVFGAFLQGERGEEDTMHAFIVPYGLQEGSGDDDSSPTLSLGVTLFPGTYRLAWGVLDATTGKAVTRDETVEVPDYGQGPLRLTRPLLAGEAIRDDSRPLNATTIYEGVRLGNVLVANDLDDVFDRDATLEVVAVVTGWASDPASPGKPRLEVAYRILEGLQGDESLARLPEQLLDFHVLGQQIPLGQVKRLQPGRSYRIEVRVKDLVSGAETVQRAPLHLREESASEPEDARR